MLLLDTDVLIDCLRGMPAAKLWLASAAGEAFGVPGVVAMELLVGSRDLNKGSALEILSGFGSQESEVRSQELKAENQA
jgi:predicted nucleic acid-binding protein